MCRVAGRRCEHGWTEAQHQADLARRRAIYHAKKGTQAQATGEGAGFGIAGAAAVEPSSFSIEENIKKSIPAKYRASAKSTIDVAKDEVSYRIGGYSVPSATEIALSASIASENVFSKLSYLPFKDEDEDFSGGGVNGVCRVTLEDGTVGYWKPHDGLDDYAAEEFGCSSTLTTMRNEAAAYRFSQILGYDGLVPETVIRVIDGYIGTIQQEARGAAGFSAENVLRKKMEKEGKMRHEIKLQNFWKQALPEEAYRKAAIFDTLIGAQDRHADNFLVRVSDGEVSLIDNGYSFPADVLYFVNASDFTDPGDTEDWNFDLTEEEREKISEIINSPNMLGMDKYLTNDQMKGVRYRGRILLDGRIHDAQKAWEEYAGE